MHLAKKYSFDELLKGLHQEIQKGYVVSRANEDGLTIYNYRHSCQVDKAWNDFTRMARGLILHLPSKQIVALPFPKFFNYGEHSTDLPEEPFEITEKLDGSLGIVYFWDNAWHIATRGSFDSPQAQWAEKYFKDHINADWLLTRDTYLVEIICQQNRIVIDYDFEGLVLLAAYNVDNGLELRSDMLDVIAEKAGLRRPERSECEFDELLSIAKSLSGDKEGFVVHFKYGHRVKIKGAEYCRIHRLISDITPLGTWRAMAAKENMIEIKRQIPEEHWEDFEAIHSILFLLHHKFMMQLHTLLEETADMSDKELGLKLPSLQQETARFLFPVRKQGWETLYTKSPLRMRFFELFKPTGNILEGYNSSVAANNFRVD